MHSPITRRKTVSITELHLVAPGEDEHATTEVAKRSGTQLAELQLVAPAEEEFAVIPVSAVADVEEKSYRCTCTPRSKPCPMHLMAMLAESRH